MTRRLSKTDKDEDAAAARLIARARKEIAAGAPLIPMTVADRIANGKGPETKGLKRHRRRSRGLSIKT